MTLFACFLYFFLAISQSLQIQGNPANQTHLEPRVVNGKPTNFKWMTRDEFQQNWHIFEPLGSEDDLPIYICRGWYKYNWIPGKFYLHDKGKYMAEIAVDNNAIPVTDYQVLYTPEHSLQWTRWDGQIPENALSIGTDPNIRERTYIGRVQKEGNTILCRISGGACFSPYHGAEQVYYFDIDILVLAYKGIKLLQPAFLI